MCISEQWRKDDNNGEKLRSFNFARNSGGWRLLLKLLKTMPQRQRLDDELLWRAIDILDAGPIPSEGRKIIQSVLQYDF
ncbi:hypothetical protein TNCV_4588441 [Trichonephila clavipes]|nr:hypothetical protein TNCV_4588441 [Trichonephila clavipes]